MSRTLWVRVASLVFVTLALALLPGCGADRANPMKPHAVVDQSRGVTQQSLADDATRALDVPIPGNAPSPSQFYPLTLHNRWDYVTGFDLAVTDDATGQTTRDSEPGTMTSSLTSIQSFNGHDYVEETREIDFAGAPGLAQFILYRQDRSGLYEADVPTLAASNRAGRSPGSGALIGLRDPRAARLRQVFGPRVSDESITRMMNKVQQVMGVLAATSTARAERAGGPLDHEITRLSYPLTPGSHWVIRDDPLFESTVENNEVVEVPAGRFHAARIHIVSDLFGPNDQVHVWYGRQGFIKLLAHLESLVTDLNGNRTGTMVADVNQDLTSLDLQGHGGPGHGAVSAASGGN